MEIRVSDIGIIHNFAWLTVDSPDSATRLSVKLTPDQLRALGHDIIMRLKEYSRTQREYYGVMEASIKESEDGK